MPYITYAVTTEYTYEDESAAQMAKTLGITTAELTKILDGDDEYVPSGAGLARLIKASEITDEEFEIMGWKK